eukprot:Amastigsp_a339217_1581.p1 type:complete len:147 gc:universal Amastigsp_a339217_1581:206-646(+)
MHAELAAQGFEVLAFPCNQFLGQEPGDLPEIIQKVDSRFPGRQFPILAKVKVNGKQAHPLFQFLKSHGPNPGRVKWNFTKWVVAPSATSPPGVEVLARSKPSTGPNDLRETIEAALGRLSSGAASGAASTGAASASAPDSSSGSRS